MGHALGSMVAHASCCTCSDTYHAHFFAAAVDIYIVLLLPDCDIACVSSLSVSDLALKDES